MRRIVWQFLRKLTHGADNIDYDDVKHLIKEETSPGKGRSISIPGQGDEKLVGFENTLFAVLAEQHNRIDDFVRSKAGEIQRRLGKWWTPCFVQ